MGLLDLLKSLAGIDDWDFSDRRSTLRIPCELSSKLEKSNGESFPVTILDIGLRGLKVRGSGKLRKGSVITLKPPKGGKKAAGVECRIEWKQKDSEGFSAGVSFRSDAEELKKSWLFEELREIGRKAVETEQRRAGIRVICNTEAKLRVENENQEVTLVDLGLGGALVEWDGNLKKGDAVRFDLGPLDDLDRVAINSEVVVSYKRKPPRYGIKFETYFDGGVTDVERYLTYFYALQKVEEE